MYNRSNNEPFQLAKELNRQSTNLRKGIFSLPVFQPLYLKHGGMPKDYMKKGGKPKGYGAKGPVMMMPKGKDNVPVMMQEDEYVLPSKAVKKMGGAKKLDKKVEKMTGHKPGKMMKGKTNYAQFGLSPEEEKLKRLSSFSDIPKAVSQGYGAIADSVSGGVNKFVNQLPESTNRSADITSGLTAGLASAIPNYLVASDIAKKGGAGTGYQSLVGAGNVINAGLQNITKETPSGVPSGIKQFFKPPSPQTTKPSYGATSTPEKRNVASLPPAYTGTGENERVFPGARGGVETVPIPKTQTDRRIYGPGGVDLGENPTQAQINKYIGGGSEKDSELERYQKYLDAQLAAKIKADQAANTRNEINYRNYGRTFDETPQVDYGAAFEPSRQNVALNIARGSQATNIANQTAANTIEQQKLAQEQSQFENSPEARIVKSVDALRNIQNDPEVAKILNDPENESPYANLVRQQVQALIDQITLLKKGQTSGFGGY